MYVIHTVSTVYKLCLCLYKLVVCFFISQIEMVLSVEETAFFVVYRLPSKALKRWFATEKRQEVKIQKRLSRWQSVKISLWGGQPYMSRENIPSDNLLLHLFPYRLVWLWVTSRRSLMPQNWTSLHYRLALVLRCQHPYHYTQCSLPILQKMLCQVTS